MKNYIPELYNFFAELSAHNNREWFAANRQRYERLRKLWMEDIDLSLIHI